jgi:hypothetical protein
MAEGNKDLTWLVQQRCKIQDLLLALYQFDQFLAQEQRERYHDVFGLLVGIAFSLWRAVFLSVPTRTMEQVTGHATRLLLILIETNAIGFPQDQRTEQWMAGYYTNNAEFRLHALAIDDIAWGVLAPVASVEDRQFFERHHSGQQDHYAETSILETWVSAFEGAERCFALLRNRKAHDERT